MDSSCVFGTSICPATTVTNHAKVTKKQYQLLVRQLLPRQRQITVFTAGNMKTDLKDGDLVVYGPSGALVAHRQREVRCEQSQTICDNQARKGMGIYIVRWNNVSSDDNDDQIQGAFYLRS